MPVTCDPLPTAAPFCLPARPHTATQYKQLTMEGVQSRFSRDDPPLSHPASNTGVNTHLFFFKYCDWEILTISKHPGIFLKMFNKFLIKTYGY